MGIFGFFKRTKRAFSYTEKRGVLYNQGYRCAHCNKRISIRSSEADHVHPYSAGGSTDGSNAQMLCRTCHKKKTKSEHGVYYGKSKNLFGLGSSSDVFGGDSSSGKKSKSKKKSAKSKSDSIFGPSSSFDSVFGGGSSGEKKSKSKKKSAKSKSDSIFGPSSSMDALFGSGSSTKKKRKSKRKSDDWGLGF